MVSLFLQHNRIRSVNGSQLKAYLSLEVLDLSSNNITEIRSGCFPPGLYIRELNLASNHIGTLELGAFDGLSRSLLFLHLSKNRITQLPIKAFKLPRLTQLLKMEPKTKGLKEQQQQHKKLLEAMLSQDSFESIHSPTPSVTEEDIDKEDDAMELLAVFGAISACTNAK
ncbi:leucine-rich repeats and immunoglobulin-like domains protein 1 isoform X2 [Marmota monax]|uniref:leucine-rich repeats and immunoglobulin-like domains protein 1 isoform X2 n=1 Tax=Marmota monax TaxID=9995 RepID=UPI0026F08FF7|nr:leucine-rich repeats and immunoglobulin-like domains protein 1 isoform X2 [Marmota monax]